MSRKHVCVKIPLCCNDLRAGQERVDQTEHSRLNSIKSEGPLMRKEGDSISVWSNIHSSVLTRCFLPLRQRKPLLKQANDYWMSDWMLIIVEDSLVHDCPRQTEDILYCSQGGEHFEDEDERLHSEAASTLNTLGSRTFSPAP